jgi:rsbT co-antagonist protein RsbR
MVTQSKSTLPEILKKHESDILASWLKEQLAAVSRRSDLINEVDLKRESGEFLRVFREALQQAETESIDGSEWKAVREMLNDLSTSRAQAGFSPAETAIFVFSLKLPLFTRLGQEFKNDAATLAREIWTASTILDRLGLFTTESYQKTREEVIQRQQQEMLELSTPVVKLWDGVLALPMIGTLDSARTQVVMETLLQKIVETGSEVAIIDITGVPQVDTLVAQHLLKTVTAARLMGAECIISGIRPQIAQTIVHLGVDLGNITTKASLADAFMIALSRTGRGVRTVSAGGAGSVTQNLGGQAAAGLTTNVRQGALPLAARA